MPEQVVAGFLPDQGGGAGLGLDPGRRHRLHQVFAGVVFLVDAAVMLDLLAHVFVVFPGPGARVMVRDVVDHPNANSAAAQPLASIQAASARANPGAPFWYQWRILREGSGTARQRDAGASAQKGKSRAPSPVRATFILQLRAGQAQAGPAADPLLGVLHLEQRAGAEGGVQLS